MPSCCICYSAFKPNDQLLTTKCGHVFHQVCIHTWLTTNCHNQTCPNCRRQIAQGFLSRLHLDFDEETTRNNSTTHELQKNVISMENKLKKMEQKMASAEKKYNTLLKSKECYQQRSLKLKEDISELKEFNKSLKKELSEERKQRKFYEHECLALSVQIEEMQEKW